MNRTHRFRRTSIVFLASLLLGRNALSAAVAQAVPQHAESSDVYEAVVRYQIKTWDLIANTYCLSISGADASTDFLKRLDPLPVKGASGCHQTSNIKGVFSVVDKKTGKRSVIFDAEAIHWIREDEAEVEGGYVCASLCSAAGTYHIVRDGNRWRVTGYRVKFQS